MNFDIKKRVNLLDLQKKLYEQGELCNEQTTVTKTENKLGQLLIDNGIKVISNFKINGKSFDFKIYHYPVLIEVDGGYHGEEKVRIKDYQKDRKAIALGFTVLRFHNNEIHNYPDQTLQQIKSVIKNLNKQPREIWLWKLSLIDEIKLWFDKRKPITSLKLPFEKLEEN